MRSANRLQQRDLQFVGRGFPMLRPQRRHRRLRVVLRLLDVARRQIRVVAHSLARRHAADFPAGVRYLKADVERHRSHVPPSPSRLSRLRGYYHDHASQSGDGLRRMADVGTNHQRRRRSPDRNASVWFSGDVDTGVRQPLPARHADLGAGKRTSYASGAKHTHCRWHGGPPCL
jgi:hypothetical protein